MIHEHYRQGRSIESSRVILAIWERPGEYLPYSDEITDLIEKIRNDYKVESDVAVSALRDYLIGYSKMVIRAVDVSKGRRNPNDEEN